MSQRSGLVSVTTRSRSPTASQVRWRIAPSTFTRIAGTLVPDRFAGAGNDDGHLTADGGSGIVTRELDQGPGARFLEHFGQLARHRVAPLAAAGGREILQQLRYTLRRLEQHDGPLAFRHRLEQAAPLAPL